MLKFSIRSFNQSINQSINLYILKKLEVNFGNSCIYNERFGKLNCDHLSNNIFSLVSLPALSAVKLNNFYGKNPSVSIDVVSKAGIIFENGLDIRPKRARNFRKM